MARTLGNLEHQRGFFLFAGLDDGLDEFHVVDVESAEGVFAFERLGEQVFGMCQWHKFMIGFWGRTARVSPTTAIIRIFRRMKIKKYGHFAGERK